MIRRLRARHRAASVALALFAPAILVAALVARPDMPRWDGTPPAPLPDGAPRTFQVDDVSLRYWVTEDERGRRVLTVAADASLEHPDVLIYASSEAPRPGADLPPDAVFLAPLAGTRPAIVTLGGATAGRTHLLLFSLPHQEVLGGASL